MITDALGAITSRKWLVELLLLAAVAGGVWWFCQHLIDVGVQRERTKWEAKVAEANLEQAKAVGRAEAADRAAQGERDALAKYVADHPLHGSLASLCKPASVPAAARSDAGNAQASAAARDFLAMPERDHRSDGEEPDQLGMLSVLAQRADGVSAGLREWQGR